MRIVADTNTIISGFLWKGPPSRLIDAALDERLTLLASTDLIAELEEVLNRSKFAKNFALTGLTPTIILARYRLLVEMVSPTVIENSPLADADDNIVLACALGGKADVIVSGDRHLLLLSSYRDIPVMKVVSFLERLETNR
jgi:putative PIN family toxin of toxin-antitoxin system